MDIEVLPSIPSNGDWVLKGQNGNPYWREDVKPDTDLSDKFAPLLGEGWAEKGQFAFGYGSSAAFTKETAPIEPVEVEPILFNATATAEGVTQELEGISCLIINPSQGATASVTYAGQTYEMPDVPEGSDSPYVAAYIFPKSGDHQDQVVPSVGFSWYNGLFEVFNVTEVSVGWLTMSRTIRPVGELPPVFVLDGIPGIMFIPITDPELVGTSYALGNYSVASGYNSIATGNNSTASGYHSVAMGDYSVASGEHSMVVGEKAEASADNSIAMGYNSTASGDYSIAMGYNSTASGGLSIASAGHSTASGDYSIAMGYNSTASGDYSVTLGKETTASGSYSVTMGSMNVGDPTKILIIGNGTVGNPKNIFTIDYDGKPDSSKIPSVNGGDLVVLGTASPTTKPAFAGQIYLDSTNKKLYVAKSAIATTDWVPIN